MMTIQEIEYFYIQLTDNSKKNNVKSIYVLLLINCVCYKTLSISAEMPNMGIYKCIDNIQRQIHSLLSANRFS